MAGASHTGSQPCDIVACKNNACFLFDCKTLENKTGLFTLKRVEENQRLAFKKAKKSGCDEFYLSIIWNNDIYCIPFNSINFSEKSISLKNIKPYLEGFYEN